jgi:site-specific recombinase XerD
MHTVKEAVGEYLMAHKHHSTNTQKNNKQRLTLFADWCEQQGVTLESLRSSHIRLFLEYVGSRPGLHGSTLKDSSVRCYGKAVKALVSWLSAQEDYGISAKVASRVELPKVAVEVIEVFTHQQITDLFAAAEKMPYPVREKAILCTLIDTGVRASELCSLTMDHIWLDADDSYLLVMGKGRKQREVPVGRVTRLAIRRYVTRYRHAAGKNEQHVFLSHVGKPLTRGGLHQIVASIGERAGVPNCHCHRFRHTFATQYLLNNNGDIYRLSRVMGHSSVRVSERYVQSIKNKQAREGESVLDRLKAST